MGQTKFFIAAFTITIFAGVYAQAQSTACALAQTTTQQMDALNQKLNADLTGSNGPASKLPADPSGLILAAVNTCVQKITAAVKSVQQDLDSDDNYLEADLCATVATGTKNGAAAGASSLQSNASEAVTYYTNAKSNAQAQFGDAGSASGADSAAGAGAGAGTSSSQQGSDTLCSQTCYADIQTAVAKANADNNKNSPSTPTITGNGLPMFIKKNCESTKTQIYALITTKITTAQQMATSSGSTSLALKIGAGVAGAAVLGAVIASKTGGHSSSSTASQANNGQVLVNGQWVDCTQTTTYTATQCQTPLMNYCSQSANASGAGCSGFNSYYCGVTGASTSYCQSVSARSYCGNAVSTVSGLTVAPSSANSLAGSPACQWLSSMPSTCAGAPTYNGTMSTINTSGMTCLATTAQLSQCANYAADPLCQAYSSGQMVYQPTGSTTTPTSTTAASTTPSTATTGTSPPIDTSLGGFTGVARAPSRNLFAETSSALSAICASGTSNLIGCPTHH